MQNFAFGFDVPFSCLTPVSAIGRSPSPSSPWGQKAAVRLTCSITAITAVLHAVLESRVRQGDHFLAEAAKARGDAPYDLARAVDAAPVPKQPLLVPEDMYYERQFVSALHALPTAFFCSHLPEISVREYIDRLASYSTVVSKAAYLMAICYLDRAIARNPHLFLTSFNVHRLLLSAFVVAAKYHEDHYIPNADFARIGGVTVEELNILEREFLKAMDFSCFITPKAFENLEQSLIEESLDTPWGLTVFQALRQMEIVGVDVAVRRTSTWTSHDVPLSPLYDIPGHLSVEKDLARAVAKIEADKAWDAALAGGKYSGRQWRRTCHIAALARALSAFTYPDIPLFPADNVELERANLMASFYPDGMLERFRTLCALARKVANTSTYLPAMRQGLAEPAAQEVHAFPPGFAPEMRLTRELSCGAAKAAVAFLLNDEDSPFDDLPPYPRECSTTSIERECGLTGLL